MVKPPWPERGLEPLRWHNLKDSDPHCERHNLKVVAYGSRAYAEIWITNFEGR